MKEKSIFEESRPEMFRLLLAEATEDVREKVFRNGAYVGGATRKRVRQLARAKARHAMKFYRDQTRERHRGQQ